MENSTVINRSIPLNEKKNLTLKESSVLFNIGINKIREMSNSNDCPFVLWVGSKRLIKKEKFEEFLENQYSI